MHRANSRNIKSWNSISPHNLGPCHIDQVNGTKFLGFHSSPFYPCRQFLFWWRVPSPDMIGPCKINQVIGTKFLGSRSLLLSKNLKRIFKLLKSLFFWIGNVFSTYSFPESHRNFLQRTCDFSFWCQVLLITRNFPEASLSNSNG